MEHPYLILRDIFPDWAVHTGVLKKGPAYYLFKVFEHIQYRAADVIGVETSRSFDYFKSTPFIDKIELLRNWTVSDRPARLDHSYRTKLALEDKVVFFTAVTSVLRRTWTTSCGWPSGWQASRVRIS